MEANTDILHNKFQAAFAHMEEEADENEAKIEGLQETIDQLGEQIYHLEDENDRLKEEGERMREEEVAERERLEVLSVALKEVLYSIFLFFFRNRTNFFDLLENFNPERRAPTNDGDV